MIISNFGINFSRTIFNLFWCGGSDSGTTRYICIIRAVPVLSLSRDDIYSDSVQLPEKTCPLSEPKVVSVGTSHLVQGRSRAHRPWQAH